jgi:hypothetical protein
VLGTIVWPFIVRVGDEKPGPAEGRMLVLDPTTKTEADGAREICVPETVIAGPPGIKVWDPMMYCIARVGDIVFEPTVITPPPTDAAGNAPGRICVLEPTMSWFAEVPSEILVPE